MFLISEPLEYWSWLIPTLNWNLSWVFVTFVNLFTRESGLLRSKTFTDTEPVTENSKDEICNMTFEFSGLESGTQ